MTKQQTESSRMLKDVRLVTVLLIGAAVLSASVLVKYIRAQETPAGRGMEVSPPTQEISANPGETITIKSKIRNPSSESVPIKVRIDDFVASGPEGQVALTEKGPYAISTWTSVTPTSFTLKPGQSQEVTATVSIPATGVAGGRYGSFVFSASDPNAPAGSTAIAQELASLFLINVKGDVVEKLGIKRFSAPSFVEFGPVKFDLLFQNEGNIHLRPQGLISITDVLGRKVADVVVAPQNVLPSAERILTTQWNSNLLVGPFTATALIINGGKSNEQVVATTRFFAFPVRIAVVIILVGIVLYMMRHRLAKAVKALGGK